MMTDQEWRKELDRRSTEVGRRAKALTVEAEGYARQYAGKTDPCGINYPTMAGVRQSQVDSLLWKVVNLEAKVAELEPMADPTAYPSIRHPHGPAEQDWSWVTDSDVDRAIESFIRDASPSELMETTGFRKAMMRYWMDELLKHVCGYGDDYCAKCGKKLEGDRSVDSDENLVCPAGCVDPWDSPK